MKRTFCPHRRPSGAAASSLAAVLFTLSFPLLAAVPPGGPERGAAALDAREQLRQQERERALQSQNAPQADTRLARPEVSLPGYPAHEKPCFTINQIALAGKSAGRFQWALGSAADARERCLGG